MIRVLLASTVLIAAAALARADTVKIPKDVLEAGWKKAECTVDLKEAGDEQEGLALSGRLQLVEVYCWRAAYQAGSIFFVVDPEAPAKAQLVRFPIWSTEKRRLDWSYALSNPDYDPETKKLGMGHKGRGMGDCGVVGSWKWTGKEFQLTGYWSKPNCDGKPFDEDRRWQVYPPRKKS
jgi:hypothetical protein